MLLILTSCQSNEQEQEQPELKEIDQADEGYELYEANSCISCHGDQLQGGSGPQLQGLTIDVDSIEDIIENGIGFMPPQQLNDKDREKLAKWLSEQ